MGARVYGKRGTRDILNNQDVFNHQSPSKIIEKQPLREKSANSTTQKVKVDHDILEQKRKPIESQERVKNSTSTPPNQPKHDIIAISIVEVDDGAPEDVATTLQNLSLDDRPSTHSDQAPCPQNHSQPPILHQTSSSSSLPRTTSTPPSIPQASPIQLDQATTTYLSPLLSLLFVHQDVLQFTDFLSTLTPHLSINKIGEGSFGEVYRATARTTTVSTLNIATPSNPSTAILKLIPLNAPRGPGSRRFTSIPSAANEVRLLERMQRIPGFVEFRSARILQGRMPVHLAEEWERYRETEEHRGKSVQALNPNGKGVAGYSDRQLWLLVEMADAGRCLEKGEYVPLGQVLRCGEEGSRYLSTKRTWGIWWQVVRAVARGEVVMGFEHRDLHPGNICAKDVGLPNLKNTQKWEMDEEDLELVDRHKRTALGLDELGVEVTIIDYSLSRADMGEDKTVSYDFWKDKQLLKGEGDLQYDIYRYQADAVGKDCSRFQPETNVLWLYLLLTKLLESTKELSNEARVIDRKKITKEALRESVLLDILARIQPQKRKSWDCRSAGDLIALGLEKGWLLESDIAT